MSLFSLFKAPEAAPATTTNTGDVSKLSGTRGNDTYTVNGYVSKAFTGEGDDLLTAS